MEKLINRISILFGLIGGCFAAYAYIQERPTRLVNESQNSLERKIEDERSTIMSYVDQKDVAKSKEIQAVNENVNLTRTILLDQIKKLDDRVYDLQRGKEYNSALSMPYDGEGGG